VVDQIAEQVAENVQQCDRVRPARDSDADRAVLGEHALAVDSLRDLLQHNLTVGESVRAGSDCVAAPAKPRNPVYAFLVCGRFFQQRRCSPPRQV